MLWCYSVDPINLKNSQEKLPKLTKILRKRLKTINFKSSCWIFVYNYYNHASQFMWKISDIPVCGNSSESQSSSAAKLIKFTKITQAIQVAFNQSNAITEVINTVKLPPSCQISFRYHFVELGTEQSFVKYRFQVRKNIENDDCRLSIESMKRSFSIKKSKWERSENIISTIIRNFLLLAELLFIILVW